MITTLLILSLTFYQNTYAYESGIVRFETGKTYVLCQDPFEMPCPHATDKTLKKRESKETASYGKMEMTSVKPVTHRKITLPIIEDMKKHKFLRKDAASMKINSIPIDSAAHSPLKKNVSNSPFAIEPQGYYEPDKQEEFLARLEEEETLEKKMQIISRAEVHFMIDDQGLYIGSADTQMLEVMRERYRGHLMRFEGYGLDEDEAQWMILSVMEVLGPGEIEEVQTYQDEDKRLVIIEVLDEI
jgi:hypothetical protein